MEGKVGAGGEIRRLHIIYFLSRTGRVEQPHLIRVHHLNRNGVHLRDVKRWLSDLRGKDMPDAFAWSYKRRYKKGFVWQDLLDDDLITPISDNEFVLKGSEIAPTGLGSGINQKQQSPPLRDSQKETQTSTEVSPEISGSFGSERSTVTEVSMNDEEEKLANKHSKQSSDDEQSDTKSDNSSSSSSSSLYSILLKKDENNENDISTSSPIVTSTSFLPPPTEKDNKRSSNGGNRASLFRNILSCGAVDTNDSALVARNKNHSQENGEIVCKGDKLGGSARVFGTHWNQKQHLHQDQYSRKSYDGGVNSTKKQYETTGKKPVCAAYKPVRGPTCSQCGKSFKPEKLHKHMKSCRGMRAMARKAGATATSGEKPPINKSTHNESQSAFSYMLTN